MEPRKMVLMILFAGQQWRCKERTALGTQCQKDRLKQTETGSLKHKHSVSSAAQSCPTPCNPITAGG